MFPKAFKKKKFFLLSAILIFPFVLCFPFRSLKTRPLYLLETKRNKRFAAKSFKSRQERLAVLRREEIHYDTSVLAVTLMLNLLVDTSKEQKLTII